MKKQGSNARLDESLGMRRGKESSKSQSYGSRRDESRGSKSSNDKYMSKGMSGLKDNTHAYSVKSVSVPECQGWGQVKPYKEGNQGYPAEAFNYRY